MNADVPRKSVAGSRCWDIVETIRIFFRWMARSLIIIRVIPRSNAASLSLLAAFLTIRSIVVITKIKIELELKNLQSTEYIE